jgi:two-component system OmpR family response regulator
MVLDRAGGMWMSPSSRPRVLIVDDDPQIVDLLSATLRFAGLDIVTASNGEAALETAAEARPDVIVLDVMLPDLDGFEIVRRLRSSGTTTPVLFLTARDATTDKVAGLTIGGDDYVTKPFSVDEVVARVQVLLRRAGGEPEDTHTYTCADLTLDDDAHLVTRGDRDLELSPTEYRILRYLLQNQGRVLSKNQILDHVWQYDFGGDPAVVEKFMSNLRRKVDREGPPLIHTVRGFGYALRPGRGSAGG